LFWVSPNVAPGWGNTLVPVENTEPIPVPEPILPIPGPAYTSPTPRPTLSSPPFVPGDLPANPDEVYMVWLRGVMPSEREEVAIVEYADRVATGSLVEPAGEDRGEGGLSRSGVPSRGDARTTRRARGRGREREETLRKTRGREEKLEEKRRKTRERRGGRRGETFFFV